MATSTIKNNNITKRIGETSLYRDGHTAYIVNRDTSSLTYQIPPSYLANRHSLGGALVFAYKDLWFMFWLTGPQSGETSIQKLTNNTNITAQVNYNSENNTFDITFSSTVWDGITIIPT